MIRKYWLSLFFIGVVLEFSALAIERQFILSAVTLAFSFAVYHFCYRLRGTALLTFMIWTYWILFGACALTCLCMFLGGHSGNIPALIRDPLSLCATLLSGLYLTSYLYFTIQLRKMNKNKFIG